MPFLEYRKHIYGALISSRCPTPRAGWADSVPGLAEPPEGRRWYQVSLFFLSKAGKKSWNSHFPNAVYEKLAGFTPLAGEQNPALRQHSMLPVPRLLDSWRWEGTRHPLGTGPGSQMLVPFTITTAPFSRDGSYVSL